MRAYSAWSASASSLTKVILSARASSASGSSVTSGSCADARRSLAVCGPSGSSAYQRSPVKTQVATSLSRASTIASRAASAGMVTWRTIVPSRRNTIPPLNAATSPSSASVSSSGRSPDIGRALMIEKPIPAARTRATASMVAGVRFLSLSTNVPSTSDTSRRIAIIAASRHARRSRSASPTAPFPRTYARRGCDSARTMRWSAR